MREFVPGRTEHVREVCRKLKPLFGDKIEKLFRSYCAEDDKGKELVENYLDILAAKYLYPTIESPPVLQPPLKEQAEGSYPVGRVLYSGSRLYDFGLRESEWIQHVGVFGRSGAGKTNVGFVLLRELTRKQKPVLVFDWKRNYRDLRALPEFQDLEVYTIGRDISPLAFNPLIPPPGTNPKTWLKKLIEVIAHAYCLGNGVMYLLQQALDAVYEEAGLYSGQVSRYPTFRDVLKRARQYDARGREAGWLSSTLRALATLCFGEMDRLVNEGFNDSLEHLLTKTVVLELDALTQSDKVFFIQALLLWIHHRRMLESTREKFKHAIFIEEAHHLLSNERRSLVGGQSVMEITFREIREFGEALVILDQHPSQISLPALGNTYCTICFNLKHQKDINVMGQCMLLEDTERELLGSLEVGQAVVKLQGRIPRAFLVEIPEFEIEKGSVSDQEIRDRMKSLPLVTDPSNGSPFDSLGANEEVSSVPIVPGPRQASTVPRVRFLQHVQAYPDSGIAERYKRLGISVRQGQKLKAELAREGLVEEQEIHVKTGRLRAVRLTEKGRLYLQSNEKTRSEPPD
jgi:hypothetical protein